jgi:Ribose/xylose/arabinose/galactoside ABC-type transport systems, permease components
MMKKSNLGKMAREFGLVFVIILIVVTMAIVKPVFLSPNNLLNVLRQVSTNGILAVGMTFVILTGGIDLSVGSIIAVTSVICGSILAVGGGTTAAIVAGVAIAVAFGIVNGYLIAYVGFQPFIATLATTTIARGFAMVYSDGKPYSILEPSFLNIGQGYLLGIPIPIIVLVIVCILGSVTLQLTTFGRYVFAIGGNKNAAKLSGVSTRKVEMMVYIISGLCCGIVGLILSARISSGQPNAAEGFELDAIAATAIGGTSMAGGLGGLRGTIFGFIIIGLISNSLNLINVNSFWQQIVKGIIILLAVLLDMKTRGKSE